jgi:salicylate hydroxylase
VPAQRLAELALPVETQVWMGPGRHFFHYYVQSEQLVNFVAIIERDTWTR